MKKFLENLKKPVVWGNIVALIAVPFLILVGVWFALNAYTNHGESVTVPKLDGSLISDAEYTLDKLDLECEVVDSSYNKNLPAGCILEQTPTPGTIVKPGRTVFLVVNSTNTPTAVVPDVADNSSLREAQARLMAIGFKLGPVEYVPGDMDWVYGVKSRGKRVYPGERVPLDVPLILQVGNSVVDEVEEEVDSIINATVDSVSAPQISEDNETEL